MNIRNFVLFLVCVASVLAVNERIHLDNVRSLTFNRGKWTNARRSSPVPQLQCVGGTAASYTEYQPATVQCVNVGSDGYNVNWKCEADLESAVRFGETTVVCEGYSSSEDPYVLVGSCGLEYTLDFTQQGRQGSRSSNNYYAGTPSHVQSSGKTNWGTVLMLVVFGFIMYSIFNQWKANTHAHAQGAGAPPPYPGPGYGGNPGYGNGYQAPPYGGGGYGSSGFYSDPASCNPTFPVGGYPPPPQNTWRPGFWSGFGAGGVMGYLFRPRTYGYGATYVQPTARTSWGSVELAHLRIFS